ncbi:MAG: aspartate aminotransferase family protein [Acidobacteriia bacterium]|nr:aspartate aminotransferase family protein [Terriglobia bacterium]
MSLAAVFRQESKLLLPTYERQPILFVRGRGVHLWDSNGKRYLDFLSGIGVNALGHAHPAIQRVIKRQAGRLIHVSNLFFHEYQAELAQRLTKISGLDRAFFCNSGTEAWEGALKLARAFARMNNPNGGVARTLLSAPASSAGTADTRTGVSAQHNGNTPKWRILALDNSFHGRTFGALATTGQEKYRTPFEPLVPGVDFVKFNDLEDLKRKCDASVCAVCIETIQGEGGIRPVSREFLELARRMTKETGALLLLDEIQSGLGRTGRHFAYQHYGIKPDVVAVAKPLASGLPLGAILTTDAVATCFHPGMHGTTFGGGPLACAVAIEFLRLEQQLLSHVRDLGKYFHAELEGLKAMHSCIREVRGLGLMQCIELDSIELAKAAVRQLLEQGIIINRTHDTVLRFLPPYIVERKHVDRVISALHAALAKNPVQSPRSERAQSGRRQAHAHA